MLLAQLLCRLFGHHGIWLVGQWTTDGRLLRVPCCLSCGAVNSSALMKSFVELRCTERVPVQLGGLRGELRRPPLAQ